MDTDPTIQPQLLVPPEEMGRILGVTGRTILYWEAAGIIKPAIRVGRTVRFDAEVVKACLMARTSELRCEETAALPSAPKADRLHLGITNPAQDPGSLTGTGPDPVDNYDQRTKA